MRILLSVDAHGNIPFIPKDVDMCLIAGDFAKGDALRKMIFEKGDPKDVKKEIIKSSKEFLSKIKECGCPIAVSLGNAEEFCKKEVVKIIKELGIIYKENCVVEINGIKIMMVDFFVEKWWARKYRSERKQTIQRAIEDENKLKGILSKINYVDIIVSHLPPYGTLDKDTGLNIKGENIGSKLLNKFILEKKPRLVVCGHIHIKGEEKIGKTRIINPGEMKVIEF